MAALSRRLLLVTRPVAASCRSITCSSSSRAWWTTPQAVKPLTDVPARMKGKAKKSHVTQVDESILEGHVNVEVLKKSMQTAVDALEWQFNKSITLRPTIALLDFVKIVIAGKQRRIKDLAQLSQQKDGFIVNCTQNPEALQVIQDAVNDSDLGLSAIASGKNTIRVPIPKVTGELRARLARMAKEAAEKARVGIRRTRGNGINDARRLQQVSSDDIRSFEKQIDLISRLYLDRVDAMLKAKDAELLK
ncbi:ribosome-recycling factor-like [Sycon ciliatum]|uniref:ribosome-recycling factor-like n=1 Tax=Sycon ciliatum TaxID=27933 RepID=UPI0020A83FEF|eukprot:scpid45633/ scgid33725/ Ribosome-recycling factor; Ribosome-releasing factor